MEKREKLLRIITEELKNVQNNNEKAIRLCKKQLHWKGIAEKVLTAIQNKTTHEITGDDMAEFIKAIEDESIYSNLWAVKVAMDQHNRIADELLQKLNTCIDEYKGKELGLLQPKQIPAISELTPAVDPASTWA